MVILVFLICHWYLALFCQTFFLHRYAAHASFEMSPFWEKFFFVFSYLVTGSAFISPRAYAITHRMHHAYTDTELDPHSPHHQNTVMKMMWRTRNFVLGIFKNTMEIDPKFSKNVPDWPWFDKIANSQASRIIWVLLYISFYAKFAPNAWYFLLLPFTVAMGPIQGAIINWCAHKYGYRNFEQKNKSTNLLRIDLIFLGESYHHNHHKYPSALNLAMRRYEFDPVYHIIRLFDKIGVVRIQKNKTVVEELETSVKSALSA